MNHTKVLRPYRNGGFVVDAAASAEERDGDVGRVEHSDAAYPAPVKEEGAMVVVGRKGEQRLVDESAKLVYGRSRKEKEDRTLSVLDAMIRRSVSNSTLEYRIHALQ